MQRFVDLATFAGVNARVQRGAPRDATLRTAGVDPATWDASLAFWLGRMADEAAQQRFGLSQRYAALFAAALQSPEATSGVRGQEPAPAVTPSPPSVASGHALPRGRR